MNANGFNLALPLLPVQLHLTTLDPKPWSHVHTSFGIEAFPLLEGCYQQLAADSTVSANESGASVWCLAPTHEDRPAAVLAWDWIVLPGEIVVRKNVPQVATNIELVAADCSALCHPWPTLIFASLINVLPWQEFVLQKISEQRKGI